MLKIFVLLLLLAPSICFSNQVYLTLVKEYTLSSEPKDIVLNDGIAYVLTKNELYGFNTTDPFSQTGVSYKNLLGVYSLSFSGRFAYTISTASGINYFDFTKDPPALKNNIATNGTLTKLVIDNGYMYVINQSAGLQVYDVNIPDFPVYKNTQMLPFDANGLFIKDRKAYITGVNAHLSIIDANDISKLPIVGTYTNGVKFYEPFVDGNYAYVPQGSTGVQVLNISKLPFPEYTTNLFARKNSKQVVASNFYVWVADDKSIEGFFNKEGNAFYFAGNYKNDKVINRIAVIEGKYLFVATADKKLKILKIEYKY
jgi:hypothetical protein